jgi:hypothetical protein
LRADAVMFLRRSLYLSGVLASPAARSSAPCILSTSAPVSSIQGARRFTSHRKARASRCTLSVSLRPSVTTCRKRPRRNTRRGQGSAPTGSRGPHGAGVLGDDRDLPSLTSCAASPLRSLHEHGGARGNPLRGGRITRCYHTGYIKTRDTKLKNPKSMHGTNAHGCRRRRCGASRVRMTSR